MQIEYRTLQPGDEAVLDAVRPDVFDNPVDPALAREFLADPRHHIVVAIDDGAVVAFVSAVRYLHPDKPDQLWINELATSEPYRRRGIAGTLLRAMLDVAREHGCEEAWLATEHGNATARGVYRSLGGDETEGIVMYTYTVPSAGPGAPAR